MEPTCGRIVHYRLSHADISRIDLRRAKPGFGGNSHRPGDLVPLIVVRAWHNEYAHASKIAVANGPDSEVAWVEPKSAWGVNGQAVLDGNDQLWVTSAPQGDFPGGWDWPPQV